MMEKDIHEYSITIGEQFLNDAFKTFESNTLTKKQRIRMRALKFFEDQQDSCICFVGSGNALKSHVYPKALSDSCNNYIDYKRNLGLSENTIFKESYYLKNFCNYLEHCEIDSLEQLTPAIIKEFLCCFSKYAPATMKRHLVTIKQFLNRLHENAAIPINYAYIIPTILYNSKDKIPSAFSNEDIKNLLSCIDRLEYNYSRQ